jgi:hypothetical protein
MQCPHCGGENNETNSFCGGCGAPLGPQCAACGHANRVGIRFCLNCGKPLSTPEISSQASDELLRSLRASGGERKRLTVLFADIRNSTGLIATIDPEQAMRRMQPVLDTMKDAVHRYDGIVNKVQGDGVMALFGAPRPHEDHAVRGCLAALAMQDAVGRLRDPDLSIRVGVIPARSWFRQSKAACIKRTTPREPRCTLPAENIAAAFNEGANAICSAAMTEKNPRRTGGLFQPQRERFLPNRTLSSLHHSANFASGRGLRK